MFRMSKNIATVAIIVVVCFYQQTQNITNFGINENT